MNSKFIFTAIFILFGNSFAAANDLWILDQSELKAVIEIAPRGTILVLKNRGEETITFQPEDLKFIDANGKFFSPEAVSSPSLLGIGSHAMAIEARPQKTDMYYFYSDAMGRSNFVAPIKLKGIQVKGVGKFRLSSPEEMNRVMH